MAGSVLVIGGANTDIIGLSDATLLPHDSNPGHVRISHGGVGRNIAENLTRLGVDVHLVTAVGDDSAGRALLDACETLGVHTAGTLVVAGATSSNYVAVMDERHDLAVAINDMRVLEHLDPEYLETVRVTMPSPALIVLDANLLRSTLERVVSLWPGVPVLLDPVSVHKAHKAKGVLGKLQVLKANELEAEVLADVQIRTQRDLDRAVDRLLEAGVREVFISRGEKGVYCANHGGRTAVRAPHVTIANTTGAGDAFAAGIAYAILKKMPLQGAAEFASAVAAITLTTERTVSEELTLESARACAEGRTR